MKVLRICTLQMIFKFRLKDTRKTVTVYVCLLYLFHFKKVKDTLLQTNYQCRLFTLPRGSNNTIWSFTIILWNPLQAQYNFVKQFGARKLHYNLIVLLAPLRSGHHLLSSSNVINYSLYNASHGLPTSKCITLQ